MFLQKIEKNSTDDEECPSVVGLDRNVLLIVDSHLGISIIAAVGGVAAAVGVVASPVALAVGPRVLRANGAYVNAVSTATEVRLVSGTAVLLAGGAVLALGVGAIVRRSAVALTAVLAVTVLPYLLAMSVLPSGAADWVLRVTPAAAFAAQQSAVEYAQVDNLYTAPNGYFPLSPAAGLAVLLAWAAAAAGIAVLLLRRRDAR